MFLHTCLEELRGEKGPWAENPTEASHRDLLAPVQIRTVCMPGFVTVLSPTNKAPLVCEGSVYSTPSTNTNGLWRSLLSHAFSAPEPVCKIHRSMQPIKALQLLGNRQVHLQAQRHEVQVTPRAEKPVEWRCEPSSSKREHTLITMALQ